jgi:peptide/nickel transport system substrate-binding protein
MNVHRRSGFVLATATAVAIAFVASPGASSAPRSSATTPIPLVNFGLPSTVSNLDPTSLSLGYGGYISELGLETLMALTHDLHVEPYLAQSVTQPNPTTYVYHLRHGVRFWDGKEMTSADVAFSLNYARRPKSAIATYYLSVKNVQTPDRYTVVVKLAHPDSNYAFYSAELWIVEKAYYDAHQATYGQPGTPPMGTGPWMPVKIDPTQGAESDANPHWWRGTVPIQHISFKFFADEDAQALAFRNGDIDVTNLLSDIKGFATTARTTPVTSRACSSFFFLSMNTKSGPWSDVHVRRAVAYAIDRSGLVDTRGGYASPISTFIDPVALQASSSAAQVKALLKTVPTYPFSVARAKQELAQSAYPHGFSSTLVEWPGGDLPTLAQAVAGQLAAIGIKLKVQVLPVAAYSGAQAGPADKRPASVTWGGCQTPTVSGMDIWLGSKNTAVGLYNTANYTPKAVDQLIAAGESSPSTAKRFAIYSQVLRHVQDDVPYVPLFLGDAAVAVSSKFRLPGWTEWALATSPPWLVALRQK